MLTEIEKYINKKTSIDFILRKLIELDKVKFILLSQSEINAMKLLNIPGLSLVLEKRSKDYLQELWAKYEFDNGVDIEE